MKTVHKLAMASAVAFSTFAFVALAGSAAQAGPISPHGRYCMQYTLGGTDCSFTSYAQCEATASGEAAECYGNTVRDNHLPVHESGGTIY
jgi:predicted secreted protein